MAEQPQEARVCIITGAGTGIGRAIADRLSERGDCLLLVGRRQEKLEETRDLIVGESSHGDASDRIRIHPADLSQPNTHEQIVRAAMDRWGRINVLVNNAAAALLAPIEQTSWPMLHGLFTINVYAAARLIAECWPAFVKQGGGYVINISSMATVDPFPGFFVYAATKSALESMTRSTHNEGREHGIRAFTIAPGAVETEMLRSNFGEDVLPHDRTLSPQEIADVAAQCIDGGRDEDDGQVITMVKA